MEVKYPPNVKTPKKIMNDRRQPIYQKYTRYIEIEFTDANQ